LPRDDVKNSLKGQSLKRYLSSSEVNEMSDTTLNPTPEANANWLALIAPFAAKIGKTPEEVSAALSGLVGEANDDAIAFLRSEADTPLEELRAVVGAGVPKAAFNNAVRTILRAAPTPAPASPEPATGIWNASSISALPPVPARSSILTSLKSGGVLKVNQDVVTCAVQSAVANKAGFFDLPKQLLRLSEQQAEILETPIGTDSDFMQMQHLLTRRSYAEVFAAMKVAGPVMSKARTDAFLEKLETRFWPALVSFQNQLENWTKSWAQGMSASMPLMFAANAMGAAGNGVIMPPGMMKPPVTTGIRTSAEAVVDEVNKVFSGYGMLVAIGLSCEAEDIQKVLENPTLPAQLGQPNKEQMLKALGITVSADVVELERNLQQYVLGIFGLSQVPNTQKELLYLSELYQVGTQIAWDRLTAPKPRESRKSSPKWDAEESSRY